MSAPINKGTRTKFSDVQIKALQLLYDTNPKPTQELRRIIAKALHITERNVKIWFQNRRQRGVRVKDVAVDTKGHDPRSNAGVNETFPVYAFEDAYCTPTFPAAQGAEASLVLHNDDMMHAKPASLPCTVPTLPHTEGVDAEKLAILTLYLQMQDPNNTVNDAAKVYNEAAGQSGWFFYKLVQQQMYQIFLRIHVSPSPEPASIADVIERATHEVLLQIYGILQDLDRMHDAHQI